MRFCLELQWQGEVSTVLQKCRGVAGDPVYTQSGFGSHGVLWEYGSEARRDRVVGGLKERLGDDSRLLALDTYEESGLPGLAADRGPDGELGQHFDND